MSNTPFDPATTVVDDIAGDYTLDVAHSRLGFSARHAMVTTVRGAFKDFEGTAHVDTANPANSKVELTIRTDSIDTGVADRDAHLRSADFFEIESHPEITFTSTNVERDGDDWTITGDLTIKGTTLPVIARGTVSDTTEYNGAERISLNLEAEVDRTNFGINWNAPLSGGKQALANAVTITAELAFAKE
jgi:polyisoprenoid-binding protein YceI